jgi:probable HAF family extracellular repeat protein
MTIRLLAILSAALALNAASHVHADTHAFIWSSDAGMKDLGSLGGTTSIAHAINDSGQVVGVSYLADNSPHAFIWTEAIGMVDIGTAGGTYSEAFAINSSGGVTGQTSLANGKSVAFYWSSSTGLMTFAQPRSETIAYGINDSNEITGERYTTLFTDKGFIWDSNSGTSRGLGNLPGAIWNDGRDINNLEHVTGPAGFPNGNQHVFLWRREDGIHDLGSPVGVSTPLPISINDQDEIVGFSAATPGPSFYWSRLTGFRILQTLAGDPTGAECINNVGNIAGYSLAPGSGDYHAVLWTDSLSAPQDLGTLPGDNASLAYGINNRGQVVGYSVRR